MDDSKKDQDYRAEGFNIARYVIGNIFILSQLKN